MRQLLIILCVALFGCSSTPQYFNMGGQYLGARYATSPLGEGLPPDIDPLIRTDAFDCTTFVETVLADGDVNILNNIRYADGVPSFQNRNHFIESDWIPNNANLVQNISAQFGQTRIRRVTIDKKSWFWHVHKIKTDFTPVTIDLEYLPYDTLPEINSSKPIVVLFIVGNCEKCDKIGTDIAVVHMGFWLPGGILRHASSAYGRVMDTSFNEYVQQRKEMKNNIGIVILGIK